MANSKTEGSKGIKLTKFSIEHHRELFNKKLSAKEKKKKIKKTLKKDGDQLSLF